MGQRPQPLSWPDLGVFGASGLLSLASGVLMRGWGKVAPVEAWEWLMGFSGQIVAAVGLAWLVSGLDSSCEPFGEASEGEPNEPGGHNDGREGRSEESEERRPTLAGHGEP